MPDKLSHNQPQNPDEFFIYGCIDTAASIKNKNIYSAKGDSLHNQKQKHMQNKLQTNVAAQLFFWGIKTNTNKKGEIKQQKLKQTK